MPRVQPPEVGPASLCRLPYCYAHDVLDPRIPACGVYAGARLQLQRQRQEVLVSHAVGKALRRPAQ